MNFRRILLTGATLGSAAVFVSACSNANDVVLTIPTTDSVRSGEEAAGPSVSGQPRKDGRFIARCATEADGDGYAGQTSFTDGSSDFTDYCLQRFYSGVQPAPGAIFVESGSGSSTPKSTPQQGDAGSTSAQRAPSGGQLLAEGNTNRTTGLDGTGPSTGAGVGVTTAPQDNFGAANAGSPNRPTADVGTRPTQDEQGGQNGQNGGTTTPTTSPSQNGGAGGTTTPGTTPEGTTPGGTTPPTSTPGGENPIQTTVPTFPTPTVVPTYPQETSPQGGTSPQPTRQAPSTTGSADPGPAPVAPTGGVADTTVTPGGDAAAASPTAGPANVSASASVVPTFPGFPSITDVLGGIS